MTLPLSHYSPVFANKAWAKDDCYITYFSCEHTSSIKKSKTGKKQWGRKRGIYSQKVENSLGNNLESRAALIYQKLLSFNEIDEVERKIWAQFILSQHVRTPSFMKYEKYAKNIHGITEEPKHDRVGCPDCEDLFFIANRNWCYLLAHEDDYFVRTDNPVFMSGFIERPETCIFYPLSPQICFVACSMPEGWKAFTNKPGEPCGYQLSKGGSLMINFYLAKSANNTLMLSPNHDGEIAETMFQDVLGIYPQPPFSIHILSDLDEQKSAYESIRMIMSATDGIEYPLWSPEELEPYYCSKKGTLPF